jgi:hypothetical protein
VSLAGSIMEKEERSFICADNLLLWRVL